MNCDNRLLTSKDVSQIETGTELVPLTKLMSESDKIQAGKFAVLLISHEGEMYKTTRTELVPKSATIVRDNQGLLVGISAVSGG